MALRRAAAVACRGGRLRYMGYENSLDYRENYIKTDKKRIRANGGVLTEIEHFLKKDRTLSKSKSGWSQTLNFQQLFFSAECFFFFLTSAMLKQSEEMNSFFDTGLPRTLMKFITQV
jgi:hypothetical protein